MADKYVGAAVGGGFVHLSNQDEGSRMWGYCEFFGGSLDEADVGEGLGVELVDGFVDGYVDVYGAGGVVVAFE